MHGCWGGQAWLLWGACMVALGGGQHVWLLWGACVVAQGACMVALGGHVWLLREGCVWDTMRYGDTVNERAVRILLECILVLENNQFSFKRHFTPLFRLRLYGIVLNYNHSLFDLDM